MTRSDTVVLGVAIAGRGVVRPGEAVFSASDQALLRGAAAFETIRVYGGRPFLLDRHVERLEHSALQLGLPRPDGAAELAALLLDGRDAVLRLFRTSETLVATVSELPPRLDELRARGIVLVSMDGGIGPELLRGREGDELRAEHGREGRGGAARRRRRALPRARQGRARGDDRERLVAATATCSRPRRPAPACCRG